MNNELKRQGEHRGDFTRDTFDPAKRFSRVLMQQGRVLLDADWNEQASILLHNARSFAADVIGPHGGPADLANASGKVQINCGFEIITSGAQIDKLPAEDRQRLKDLLGAPTSRQMLIGKGHYYVNGILCENDDYILYSAQPDRPLSDESKLDDGRCLVYLDVWERHVTHYQDGEPGDPGIREVALGGPDTASRAQVIWQVKVTAVPVNFAASSLKDPVAGYSVFATQVKDLLRPGAGKLMARAKKPTSEADDCACVTSPESRYRGVENQLYRVEVHAGARAGSPATFKWSRENGSVVFPISKISGPQVTVGHLGRDERYGLEIGDWVEVVDNDYTFLGNADPLLRVEDVDRETRVVTLSGTPTVSAAQPLTRHPLLRRWDSAGLVDLEVPVPTVNGGWLSLEEGVEISFVPDGPYRTGDYWLIPARVATGDVEWPGTANNPDALPPHGVQHYYAPLAVMDVSPGGIDSSTAPNLGDCRRSFTPLAK